MEREFKNNYLLFFVILVVALEAILFSVENFKLNESTRLQEEHIQNIKQELDKQTFLAKAISIYDITKVRKIYGKNDTTAMPLASLAKAMTVLVALDSVPKETVISISPNAISQNGDYGLYVGEKWKIEDLSRLTLISSANDGAYALADDDHEFLNKMNSKARRIGMKNTLFINPTGLDLDALHAGSFASAEDVNMMAAFALLEYPEIFNITTREKVSLKSLSGFVHKFKNTDVILSRIPNLLFSKTGYTEVAGGNLVVVLKDKSGDAIAITILGSTFEGRFADMEKIVKEVY